MRTAVTIPTINANDEFVVLVRWHVPDGGEVEAGAPLMDVETTKAVVAVEAVSAGWLKHGAIEGEEIAVGSEVGWIFPTANELEAAGPVVAKRPPVGTVPSAAARASAAENVDIGASEPGPSVDYSVTRLSPSASTLARSLGLDLEALAANKLGLLTSAGVRKLATRDSICESLAVSNIADSLRAERLPLAKRSEIQALREGADGTLRSSLTIYFDSHRIRTALAREQGILPLVVSEAAQLLAVQPRFTAFCDNDRIVFYDAVHIGVAIDLGLGLKVVVIRNAATLDTTATEGRLGELALDYMQNQLAPGDVQGATFTVTDLSSLDILQFEPLLNGRQSAILGIGGDTTLPGHPMSLTLTFDHRVLTGREVGLFLRALRDRILAHDPGEISTEDLDASSTVACCDRCQIDVGSYYEKFGRVGVMQYYVRPDGTPGLICHACLASF